MGEIVAAIGTCHTPYMFTRPPDENPEQLDQAGRAMNELGKVLDETKPDVIIFLGADHVETFSVTCVPTFAIVAGSVAHAKFAGREHKLPIHRETGLNVIARGLLEFHLAPEEVEHVMRGAKRAPGVGDDVLAVQFDVAIVISDHNQMS